MTTYLRVFNFLVRRVMAVVFATGGFILTCTSVSVIFPGGTINVDGVPSEDLVFRWVAVVLPMVIAALGVALYRVKPFLPLSHHG
jgi:hypothetical protein